jgi:hypothetical protein
MHRTATRKTHPPRRAVENWLDRAASTLLAPDDGPAIDFSRPPGEAALTAGSPRGLLADVHA